MHTGVYIGGPGICTRTYSPSFLPCVQLDRQAAVLSDSRAQLQEAEQAWEAHKQATDKQVSQPIYWL